MSYSYSYRESIFTQSIEQLQNIPDKKDLINDLSDINWINTLDASKINEMVMKIICISDDDAIAQFISNLQKTTVRPEPLSDKQWLSIFKYAHAFWMKKMISGHKYLTTGTPARDPESKEEEILYCLETSLQGMEKMPPEIVNYLLGIVDLTVMTPNYHQDALDAVCHSGNIDYIKIILQRAVNEKSRADLLEYIQDRMWIRYSENCTVDFMEKLVNLFHTLDLPFSEAVHGKYSHFDILNVCNKAQILEICVKYLPTRHKDWILHKRAFELLCNFIHVETEELQKTIEILEKEGVDLSKIFEKRCEEKGMCLLDKVCLEGRAKSVSYILSKMSDESKRKALVCKNYGFRTPLTHARYYSYGNKEKENIIMEEMSKLGLQ